MKRLISTLLLVAFTTAVSPVNAFGPTPGQLEYQNYGYSQPYNQYGSFSPTPQQNQYNDYNSYDYNQNGGSYGSFSSTPQQNQYSGYNSYNQNTSGGFSNTPQQGWGNTNPDGIFYVPQEYCSHWQNSRHEVASWCEEYNESKHIKYKEYEVVCYNCNQVIDSYTQQDYEEHRFTSYNQCSKCGYTAECNHGSTSLKTYTDYFEPIDGYNHTEVYVEKTVCSYCGEVLYSQPRTRNSAHYFQYDRCWTCGYVQQTTSQPQYTPPVVNQPEYVEPEEEPVYVEQPQQSTSTPSSNVVSYQQELEQGITYATTVNGLYLYKRKYNPSDYRGYTDDPFCTLKTAYDVPFLPYDEVLILKGAYLYRLPEKGGAKVGAAPWIIKACDYRINELKTTLKGLPDASSRVEQYKQVKRGKISLTSIPEQNRTYIATSNQSHSKVSEVQAKLQQLGYASQTEITGKIDTKTLNNIAYFQRTNGILSTGWLDNETYNAIMSYGTNNNYADTSNNNYSSNQMPSITLTSLADGIQVEKGIIPVQVVGNEYTTRIDVLVYDKEGFLCKTEEYTSNLNWDMRLVDTGEYDLTILAINNYTGAYVEKNITIKVIDNSSASGTVTQFTLGVWDAVTSTGEGLWQIVSHPVQTVISLPSAIAYMVKAVVPGTEENLIVGTIALQVMAEMEENSFQENARYVGRITGEILIALLVSKGIDKGMEAVKSSAQTGKIGKIISLVAKGEDSADNIATLLRNGGKLFADNGQVTYASIVANASEFAGKSADDIANMLRNAGYKGVYVEKSVEKGSSAMRVVVSKPDKTHNIAQILVSPGSVRHGNVPYVKISTNDIRVIKVVDGSPSQYISAGETERRVIFLKP